MITAGIALNSYKLIIQLDLSQTFIFILQLMAYLIALYMFIPHMAARHFQCLRGVSALCEVLFDASPSWALKPASWVWEVDHEN